MDNVFNCPYHIEHLYNVNVFTGTYNNITFRDCSFKPKIFIELIVFVMEVKSAFAKRNMKILI